MTKVEIVQELHENGEVWADISYPKDVLARYLTDLRRAQKMTDEELKSKTKEKKL